MKLLLVATLMLASTAVPAAEWKAKSEPAKLSEEGFIFAALNAQIQKLAQTRELESTELELLEELILKTNVEALEDYDRDVLKRFPVASVHFLLGREAWKEKQHKEAQRWLATVPRWHRYYPEARMLMADMTHKEGHQQQCLETARKRAGEVKSKLLKRYYTVLAEDCLTMEPRKLYKAEKFTQALEGWGQISKQAYKWPTLLLEKAWAHYNLKDYNRTLGLLVTYKSPLLSSYSYPEAEVLTALAYFRLCLYDDALVVIDQYYNVYKPRTEALEGILRAQKSSQDYFYRLMVMSPEEREKVHPFIRQLATQVAHRPRFALDISSLSSVQAEINKLRAIRDGLPKKHVARSWMSATLKQLEGVKTNLVGRINYHAKLDLFAFISDVYRLSEEMFKIKLEIISRKKDLVYGQKNLISNRGRGDFSQVKMTRFEEFWKFQGAFWADELGDYSFGLPSNCETVRKEENP
jgi:hypothetical protein